MTELDTFNRLRRESISVSMLDYIDPRDIDVDQFKSAIKWGSYDAKLKIMGWNRNDFYDEYSLWIKNVLENAGKTKLL